METVNDIIKVIRQISYNISVADEKTLSRFRPVAALVRIADRLEVAYKHDLQAMDEIPKLRKTIAGLRKSNEVLECARDFWIERADELRRRCEALNNGGVE